MILLKDGTEGWKDRDKIITEECPGLFTLPSMYWWMELNTAWCDVCGHSKAL